MKSYDVFHAGGAFHRATGSGEAIVVDPSTGEPTARVALCSATDVDRAVDAAQSAFATWRHVTVGERQTLLKRLRDELAARTDAIVQSLAVEMGCPVWLGRLMQVPMPIKGLDFAIDGLDAIAWTEQVGNGLVERVPVGVVAAITPWNFPLHQIVAKVAAAVAAGCTVVLKPSEVAPGAAQAFIEAVAAAGFPPGVVNLVWGGPDVGASLVADPGIDKVSFTGSTPVGRRILAAAAPRLKPVTLELGGKSAAVLLDDADLDAALPVVVRLALANSGQACVAQSRLIAPRASVPTIVERFRATIAGWPLGDPRDDATRLGPLATKTQFDHVDALIGGALDAGATLAAGGAGPAFDRGWFVRPTLFTDVAPTMAIARDEVFGPVLAVLGYDDEDEALALANATDYGLSGAVWSADAARATRFARRMTAGQVVVNGAQQNLATPFGGRGASGFGRENGRFGIEEMLVYRAVHGAVAA